MLSQNRSSTNCCQALPALSFHFCVAEKVLPKPMAADEEVGLIPNALA